MTAFIPKRLLLFLLFLLCSVLSFAYDIKGKVYDAKTGEPLAGAIITLESSNEKKYVTYANLDGSFNFKNLPAGSYELKANSIGYKSSEEFKLSLKSSTETLLVKDIELMDSETDLKEVKVTSSLGRGTDKQARGLEKKSDVVINVLSAKAIELSPDVTVANALQRMSGISVQNSSSGEARHAIIRGMDQRYNNTLVNGIKIPSPDDKYRYVPMDIFPSDLVERIEVIKSLTPSMEPDAVGGTINLVMKNAPNKKVFTAFVATGANTLFNDRPFMTFNQNAISAKDPTEKNGSSYLASNSDFPRSNLHFVKKPDPIHLQVGLTYGDRFLHKKLGMIFGISFQNNYRGSDVLFNKQYAQGQVVGAGTVNNYPHISDAYTYQYSNQQRRAGINNKWDYVINKNNKISLFNMFVYMDELQARYSHDIDESTNPGTISDNYRTRWQRQYIYNSTLHGEHNLSKLFSLNWDAVYSYAKKSIPDYAQFTTGNHINPATLQLDSVNNWINGTMDRTWTRNSDQDVAGYLNLVYAPKILGKVVEWTVGGLYRHKNRDNYYHQYQLSPKNSGSQTYYDIFQAQYNFNGTNGDNGSGNYGTGLNYTVKENVGAGFVQFKFRPLKKLQTIGGLRVENTDDNYNTNLPIQRNYVYGHIYYTDFLPSLQFKYELNNKQNLRASYFRSIVRPGYIDLVPYKIPSSENEQYDQQGNPLIKHTVVDNYDIRYELYPDASSQIFAGVFLKTLQNPIEVTFQHTSVSGGNASPGDNYLTPTNWGTATNYGAELVFNKYFGKFGINLNYTYTHSAITTDKYYTEYLPTSGTDTTVRLSQTRPLQGQSNHIGNASVIFKDSKLGLEAQLAFVYTGERIAQISNYYNLDTWQEAYGQLDFSFEWKLNKTISLYGKITNLTNSQPTFYLKQPYIVKAVNSTFLLPGQTDPNKIIVQKETYQINYLGGLRFKLK